MLQSGLLPTAMYNSIHNSVHDSIRRNNLPEANGISISPAFMNCFCNGTLQHSVSPTFLFANFEQPLEGETPSPCCMPNINPLHNVIPNTIQTNTAEK